MPTRHRKPLVLAVLGLSALAFHWLSVLDQCTVDPVNWERVYVEYHGQQVAAHAVSTHALAHLQADKENLRQAVLSLQLQLSTRPGANALAAGYWECKSLFLHLLAAYLHSSAAGRGCLRLAAVRAVYRTLVLAWQLHQEGEPVAADTALLMAAAQLGFDWQTFDPLAYPTEGQPSTPFLPACAHAWSILRFMWAGEAELPSTLYPWHMEAGGLSPGWRELMARAANDSLESEAGRLGGQMEAVSTAEGQQLLLWVWPTKMLKPKPLDMISHAFKVEYEGGADIWRALVLWKEGCLIPGLIPDRPLLGGLWVKLSIEMHVVDNKCSTLELQGSGNGAASASASAILEFPTGSWAPAMLSPSGCLGVPPGEEGEVLLSINITPLSPDGLPARHTCTTLLPNKYYKTAPLAFLRRWGLPPATPGFGESQLLASGQLHAARGWQRLGDTLPWERVKHARVGMGDWGAPVTAPWRAAGKPPECRGSPECKALAADYEQWRGKQAGPPSFQQQLAYWQQASQFWWRQQQAQQQRATCMPTAGSAGSSAQRVLLEVLHGQGAKSASAPAGDVCWPSPTPSLPAPDPQKHWLLSLTLPGGASFIIASLCGCGALLSLLYRWVQGSTSPRVSATRDTGLAHKAGLSASSNSNSSRDKHSARGPEVRKAGKPQLRPGKGPSGGAAGKSPRKGGEKPPTPHHQQQQQGSARHSGEAVGSIPHGSSAVLRRGKQGGGEGSGGEHVQRAEHHTSTDDQFASMPPTSISGVQATTIKRADVAAADTATADQPTQAHSSLDPFPAKETAGLPQQAMRLAGTLVLEHYACAGQDTSQPCGMQPPEVAYTSPAGLAGAALPPSLPDTPSALPPAADVAGTAAAAEAAAPAPADPAGGAAAATARTAQPWEAGATAAACAGSPAGPPQAGVPLQEDEDECLMCLDAARGTTLAPCGHRVLCLPCTLALLAGGATQGPPLCPVCRVGVASYILKEYRYI